MRSNPFPGTSRFLVLIALIFAPLPCMADVQLPHILASNMVLQQGQAVPIWGKANPGEQVTITFADQSKSTTAGADGKWQVALSPLAVSKEGRTLTVKGTNTIALQNVLVGEVWICSGQSNMALPVLAAQNGRVEAPKADFPQIRLFRVPLTSSPLPQEDCPGEWALCSPTSAPKFSAVGYYFGRELLKTLDVPVGLVDNSWGGKAIATFTPHEALPGSKPLTPAQIDKIKLAMKARQEKEAQEKVQEESATEEPGATPEAKTATPAKKKSENVPPSGIYNGMVAPLMPLAIRGTIWYQGEADRNQGLRYTQAMEALIGSWRKAWGQGDFPFYFVQLAPFKWFGNRTAVSWPPREPPTTGRRPEHTLPMLWQAQLDALKIPNTGMVVTLDVGTRGGIHPPRKLEVGQRLAWWALAKTYGKKDLVYSGPLYKSITVDGASIRVHFDEVGGGLASRDGGPLNWFEIAGADKVFYPATAEIKGPDVVLSCGQVKAPVAARFSWDEVAEPNLINKEGLPASSFISDPSFDE